jgi:hypothetical protein
VSSRTAPRAPCSYVYDLAQKADRSKEFFINGAEFDAQDWRAVGLGPTNADAEALRVHFTTQLNALADICYWQRLAAAAPTEMPPDTANTEPKAANTDPTMN